MTGTITWSSPDLCRCSITAGFIADHAWTCRGLSHTGRTPAAMIETAVCGRPKLWPHRRKAREPLAKAAARRRASTLTQGKPRDHLARLLRALLRDTAISAPRR